MGAHQEALRDELHKLSAQVTELRLQLAEAYDAILGVGHLSWATSTHLLALDDPTVDDLEVFNVIIDRLRAQQT